MFKHILFHKRGGVRLYGSNITLDGISNPIGVSIGTGDWACEATGIWRELPYADGVKYAYP